MREHRRYLTHVLAIRRSRGPSDHYRDEENDHKEKEFGECRKALAFATAPHQIVRNGDQGYHDNCDTQKW